MIAVKRRSSWLVSVDPAPHAALRLPCFAALNIGSRPPKAPSDAAHPPGRLSPLIVGRWLLSIHHRVRGGGGARRGGGGAGRRAGGRRSARRTRRADATTWRRRASITPGAPAAAARLLKLASLTAASTCGSPSTTRRTSGWASPRRRRGRTRRRARRRRSRSRRSAHLHQAGAGAVDPHRPHPRGVRAGAAPVAGRGAAVRLTVAKGIIAQEPGAPSATAGCSVQVLSGEPLAAARSGQVYWASCSTGGRWRWAQRPNILDDIALDLFLRLLTPLQTRVSNARGVPTYPDDIQLVTDLVDEWRTPAHRRNCRNYLKPSIAAGPRFRGGDRSVRGCEHRRLLRRDG